VSAWLSAAAAAPAEAALVLRFFPAAHTAVRLGVSSVRLQGQFFRSLQCISACVS
jgi:hypothetical protein